MNNVTDAFAYPSKTEVGLEDRAARC